MPKGAASRERCFDGVREVLNAMKVNRTFLCEREGLTTDIADLMPTCTPSAKGDMMWPDGQMKLLSDQVLDSVDVAEACGGHANLEPCFTDAPWKMALFTQAITQTRKTGVVLAAME